MRTFEEKYIVEDEVIGEGCASTVKQCMLRKKPPIRTRRNIIFNRLSIPNSQIAEEEYEEVSDGKSSNFTQSFQEELQSANLRLPNTSNIETEANTQPTDNEQRTPYNNKLELPKISNKIPENKLFYTSCD